MFASALLQYNSTDRTFSSNLRYRWEYRPGSEFFVVWTDEHDTRPNGIGLRNRAFVVKADAAVAVLSRNRREGHGDTEPQRRHETLTRRPNVPLTGRTGVSTRVLEPFGLQSDASPCLCVSVASSCSADI